MELLRSFFEYLKRIYRFFHHVGAVLSTVVQTKIQLRFKIIGFYFNPSTALYMRVLWCQGLSQEVLLEWIHFQERLFVRSEKERKKEMKQTREESL